MSRNRSILHRAAIDFQMHGLEIVKCREAMRLFPVAPFLTRIQQKSLDIDGFEILQWEILKELENDFSILLYLKQHSRMLPNLSTVLILAPSLTGKRTNVQ